MTETPPLISIIIPVYKVEPYLRQCLDSVLAQTYPHWEAICINDGSPDNCGAILDEYAAKDSRFIVIHQENQGVSVARNRGLGIMKGKYLTLLDADDWLSPNALDCIITAMEESYAELGRCSFTEYKSDNSNKEIIRGLSFYNVSDLHHHHSLCILDRKNLATCAGGAIFHSSIIKENHITFTPHAKMSEDIDFIINYLQHTHTISYIFSPVYNYRTTTGVCHDFDTNKTRFSEEQINAMILILHKLGKYTPSTTLSNIEKKGFRALQLQSLLIHYTILKKITKMTKVPVSIPIRNLANIFFHSNFIDSTKLLIKTFLPISRRFYNKNK